MAGLMCVLGMTQGYLPPRSASPSKDDGSSTGTQTKPGHGSSTKAATGDGCSSSAGAGSHGGHGVPASGVVLMRQLDQYGLFPTAGQLQLLDKKFGGGVCLDQANGFCFRCDRQWSAIWLVGQGSCNSLTVPQYALSG